MNKYYIKIIAFIVIKNNWFRNIIKLDLKVCTHTHTQKKLTKTTLEADKKIL